MGLEKTLEGGGKLEEAASLGLCGPNTVEERDQLPPGTRPKSFILKQTWVYYGVKCQIQQET